MRALSLLVQKLMPMLSFLELRLKLEVNFKVRDQIFCMDRKVLPQGISKRNTKALSLSVQKLVPRLSFFQK